MPFFSFSGNLDSLLRILKNAQEKELASLCNQISREYLLREPLKSLDCIDKAINYGSKFKQTNEIAKAYFYKGFFYKKMGRFSQARYFLFKVVKLFPVTKDSVLVSKAYNNLAQVEQAVSHYDKAIGYIEKTIDLKNKIGDERGQAIAYLTLGNIYNTKGEYQKSIFHYQNTLKIARKINNKKLIASALNSIGLIYENLANYKNLNNLNEALK
jgi:tetratricopeptide (TPR) repeat protein